MDTETKYTFVPLVKKENLRINAKPTRELLSKWGLEKNFIIQRFSFNEPFHQYHKYHLAEAFFKNETVAKELFTKDGRNFRKQGKIAKTIDLKQVPCTVSNMSFFHKLKNSDNGIVYKSGTIRKRYDTEILGFSVCDKLREMLLDDESESYALYDRDERDEFIFRIFQMVVLGGILCQYEDTLDPYLEVTKNIYKDLIRVKKPKNSEILSVSTLAFEVVVKDHNDLAYFPWDPSVQNIGFFLVDGDEHEITTFLHQFGEFSLLP